VELSTGDECLIWSLRPYVDLRTYEPPAARPIETDEAEDMTRPNDDKECRRLLERAPVPADEEANARRRRAAPRRRACDLLLRRLFFPHRVPSPSFSLTR
jgi:hypothetical protein